MQREISTQRNTQTRQPQGDGDKRLAGYTQRLRLLQRLQSKQLQLLKGSQYIVVKCRHVQTIFIYVSLHRFNSLGRRRIEMVMVRKM